MNARERVEAEITELKMEGVGRRRAIDLMLHAKARRIAEDTVAGVRQDMDRVAEYAMLMDLDKEEPR